jgi:hypothetical protein
LYENNAFADVTTFTPIDHAYVRNGEKWYLVNDTAPITQIQSSNLSTKDAMMLFYRKRTAAAAESSGGGSGKRPASDEEGEEEEGERRMKPRISG